ncbi:MAG: CDP-diacylglycerol--glycerol-3-phosphate 3-phosphatidyltransferase [Candidatus Tectomicrobia bacterium]|nr:CDP-diacylglycerol--glycerol-3-phosphate 3-phosphatidyltransferase [Candidatus Tectomicrobia bacterium]
MIPGTQSGAPRPEPKGTPSPPENGTSARTEAASNGTQAAGVLSLPNRITLCRIVAAPIFLILVVYGYHRSALFLFILSSLTDALDGFLARTYHQRTRLGRILDPLADKLLLAAAFIVMAMKEMLPAWITIVVVSRDALIVLGALLLFLATGQLANGPSKLGKATTAAQFCLIILVLAFPVPAKQPAFVVQLGWLTAFLTAASGVHYLYHGMRRLNDA